LLVVEGGNPGRRDLSLAICRGKGDLGEARDWGSHHLRKGFERIHHVQGSNRRAKGEKGLVVEERYLKRVRDEMEVLAASLKVERCV